MSGSSGTGSMEVHVDAGGALVVHGDIDMAGGPLLDARLIEVEGSRTDVIIDLQGVGFIDSSGLRSLLGASRRASIRGGTVTLRSVGTEVNRLLEITGTTDQFRIEDSHGIDHIK